VILIYSHKLTNRLQYIFKVIFKDVLLSEVSFTTDKEEFNLSSLPKLNYSYNKLNDELFFQCSSILFETGLKEQNINVFEYDNTPCFFNVGKDSIWSFDPFAASFYLVSRFEEYLPHIKDEHNRFIATESLAYQKNFLHIPLVNIWANKIASILETSNPTFKFPQLKYKQISTIDIDNAYAYKNKGLIRTIGSLGISLFKTGSLKKKIDVLLNKTQDPYDTFNYQFQIHKKYNVKPIYFFLLADYGLNDKNISVKNKAFQSLIKSIADYYEVGIHPSYASNTESKKLPIEINRLQEITHKNITKSRQHFLKLILPDTYRGLIDNDIKNDYSMGYASKTGFRASICSAYHFYDLDTEVETDLLIHPFCVMEGTYQYYEKVNAEKALDGIMKIILSVKKVNGTFISVWHNESLSNEEKWEGWRDVYEKMLEFGSDK